MITCQQIHQNCVCVFSVERSPGQTFQLKMADYEEVLARVRKEKLSGVILKPKQNEEIKRKIMYVTIETTNIHVLLTLHFCSGLGHHILRVPMAAAISPFMSPLNPPNR